MIELAEVVAWYLSASPESVDRIPKAFLAVSCLSSHHHSNDSFCCRTLVLAGISIPAMRLSRLWNIAPQASEFFLELPC